MIVVDRSALALKAARLAGLTTLRVEVLSVIGEEVVDPILNLAGMQTVTGLAEENVRLGVLELKDAGYLWEGTVPGNYAPECPMFAEFAAAFLPFDPSEDATAVAVRMTEGSERVTDTSTLAEAFGWDPRRINCAICYLLQAGAIEQRLALASKPWRAVQLVKTDATLRFARSRSRNRLARHGRTDSVTAEQSMQDASGRHW